MTEPMYGYPSTRRSPRAPSPRPRLNVGKLWAGGVATAVVAGLIVIVGMMIVRGLLDIRVVGPSGNGGYDSGTAMAYAFLAAIAALLATGLMHVLVLAIPRPITFFGWIAGLATVGAALVPLMVDAPLDARIGTAVINFVTGVAILSLVGSVAGASVRRPPPVGFIR